MFHQQSAYIDSSLVPIIGTGVSRLTFPGFFVRALLVQCICKIVKVKVNKIHYFKLQKSNDKHGSVDYEKHEKLFNNLIILVIPFIALSISGLLVTLPAVHKISVIGEAYVFDYILLWIGISISANAMAGNQEIEHVKDQFFSEIKKGNKPLLLLFPFWGITNILLLLRSVNFEFLYGIFIAFMIPNWIMS